MIQRVDRIGPRPALAPDDAATERAVDPTRRFLEAAWIAVLIGVGASLGAIVLLRAISGPRSRTTALPTAVATAEAALDLDSIEATTIRETVAWLASDALMGRDTPSAGLREAQVGVAERLARMGVAPVPESAWPVPREGLERLPEALRPYAWPYRASALEFGDRALEEPEAAACALECDGLAPFELGRDFVPLASSSPETPTYRGSAAGPLVFAGFGIDNDAEGYDDFAGVEVAGRIALVLGGEPEGGFKGAEVTAEASLWNKIDALAREGAVGALVVAEGRLAFHASRARWNPPTFDQERAGLPTLMISAEAAERLLGRSPAELARAAASAPLGAAERAALLAEPPSVRLAAATVRTGGPLVNVVGHVPGRRRGEYVIVTAHLDHIGVGPRGRIGRGANDNGSGVAAVLELAEAVAESPLEPTVLFAFTSGEEDGLLGARAIAAALPRGLGRATLCLNFDMVGHGDPFDCVLLAGAPPGALPALEARMERAAAAREHGLRTVRRVEDASFFGRSDHYAFYAVGIPSIFVFEAWPHDATGVYHTWLDTAETVDADKVARVARLGALLLAPPVEAPR